MTPEELLADKDETTPMIIAQSESSLRARGVEPYPGSVIEYCPLCKIPVRLSPKSQKSIANNDGFFVCLDCAETKIMPIFKKRGVTFHMSARGEEDLKRLQDAATRAGLPNIPLGSYDMTDCEWCKDGLHRACVGQGCGCKSCQQGDT